MYNNVDLISESYEDIASGKLQIRRFQPLHSGLTTVIRETLSNYIEMIYIILPETRVIALHFGR